MFQNNHNSDCFVFLTLVFFSSLPAKQESINNNLILNIPEFKSSDLFGKPSYVCQSHQMPWFSDRLLTTFISYLYFSKYNYFFKKKLFLTRRETLTVPYENTYLLSDWIKENVKYKKEYCRDLPDTSVLFSICFHLCILVSMHSPVLC